MENNTNQNSKASRLRGKDHIPRWGMRGNMCAREVIPSGISIKPARNPDPTKKKISTIKK